MKFFILMITSSFLRNVHLSDDNSSFARWDRVFLRLMKPICASWTANVKVNEGFWSRAAENIYSANFTVKFPLCRNGKWNWSYYDRHVRCLRYMLREPTFCLIYRHTLVLISALFNALLVADLFALLYVPSFLPLERAICHSRYPRKNEIFPDFQLRIHVRRDTFPPWFVDLDIHRSNLYFISYFTVSFLPSFRSFPTFLRFSSVFPGSYS